MAGDAVAENKPLHLPSRFGDLPACWSWIRLDDACDGVFDCPHSTPRLADTGPFVVRSQDIITGVFRTEEAARVSEETYNERTSRVIPARGDLLYSREGTYFGIAAQVPERTRVCLGQRMVLIRPKSGVVDFRFLCHWLNSPIMASHIHGYRDGTVAERLNLPTIRALPVLVPPLPEQRAIANILGTLDDKIELNRRMNETLEAMARALFKSWFVDFDPVHAKAEGRRPHLPKDIADLFPNRFEDSELGEIPAGWRIGNVGEFATLGRDGMNPVEFPDETFDHFSIPAFDEGRKPKSELGSAIKSNKFIVPPNSVLISKLNPRIPRIWLPDVRNNHRAICSTEFFVMLPRTGMARDFIYGFLSSETFSDVFETLVTGTSGSHQRVKPEVLLTMDAVIPAEPVIHQFTKVVRPLSTAVGRARDESEILTALRDTLLPRLLSGQLRLNDIERFVRRPEMMQDA